MSEKEIQMKVVNFLKSKKIIFKKNQEGLRSLPQSDGTLKSYMASTGYPDLELFVGMGRVFFIELKTDNGTFTLKQKIRFEELIDAGYRIYVLREKNLKSFTSLDDIYACLGVLDEYKPS